LVGFAFRVEACNGGFGELSCGEVGDLEGNVDRGFGVEVIVPEIAYARIEAVNYVGG
jgi:hypothetical protein